MLVILAGKQPRLFKEHIFQGYSNNEKDNIYMFNSFAWCNSVY